MFGSSSHPILQASEQGPQATSGTRTSCTPCATRQGKYTVELFKEGGEGTGVERVLAGNDDLAVAVSLYELHRIDNPKRFVMLCDRARVIRRSDRRIS